MQRPKQQRSQFLLLGLVQAQADQGLLEALQCQEPLSLRVCCAQQGCCHNIAAPAPAIIATSQPACCCLCSSCISLPHLGGAFPVAQDAQPSSPGPAPTLPLPASPCSCYQSGLGQEHGSHSGVLRRKERERGCEAHSDIGGE